MTAISKQQQQNTTKSGPLNAVSAVPLEGSLVVMLALYIAIDPVVTVKAVTPLWG
jgi:hypothetical protein